MLPQNLFELNTKTVTNSYLHVNKN